MVDGNVLLPLYEQNLLLRHGSAGPLFLKDHGHLKLWQSILYSKVYIMYIGRSGISGA